MIARPHAKTGQFGITALFALAVLPSAAHASPSIDARGGQFIGLTRFSNFQRGRGGKPGEIVLTSPVIVSRIHWDELVESWNAEMPETTYLKVEVRAVYPARA